MEKYTKAQMEVIEFENEDVITSSTICPDNCTFDGASCSNLIGFGCKGEKCEFPE